MRFGPFEIERPLGRGGMAETFVARYRSAQGFERRVCLKRILAEHAASPEFVRAFQAEARVAMHLVHPHIAQVYDFGEIEGTWWMSLELVGGGDLRDLFHRLAQPMPVDLALLLAIDLASALMYAHELEVDGVPANVVHRDVSPSNILVDEQGNFKLVDFGIAKSALAFHGDTTTGKVKGKASYMAPEQGLGRKVDARADLWALGVVLYEALSGMKPFEAGSDLAIIMRVTQGDRRPLIEVAPHVPPELCAVVEKLLTVDVEGRVPSAAAVLDALERLPPPPNARRRLAQLLKQLSGRPLSEPPPPAPEATVAITSLALAALPRDEPVPSAPDEATRTRTVFDAELPRALEAGTFEATARHDSVRPPGPEASSVLHSESTNVIVDAAHLENGSVPSTRNDVGAGAREPAAGPNRSIALAAAALGIGGGILGAAIAAWLVVRSPAAISDRISLPPTGPLPTASTRAAPVDPTSAAEPPNTAVARTSSPTPQTTRGDAGVETDTRRTSDASDVAAPADSGSRNATDRLSLERSDGARRPSKAAREGSVEIVVVPWGRVIVNGVDVGRSPYRGNLPPGLHQIEVVAGDLRARRTILVRAGSRQRVSVSLSE